MTHRRVIEKSVTWKLLTPFLIILHSSFLDTIYINEYFPEVTNPTGPSSDNETTTTTTTTTRQHHFSICSTHPVSLMMLLSRLVTLLLAILYSILLFVKSLPMTVRHGSVPSYAKLVRKSGSSKDDDNYDDELSGDFSEPAADASDTSGMEDDDPPYWEVSPNMPPPTGKCYTFLSSLLFLFFSFILRFFSLLAPCVFCCSKKSMSTRSEILF